MDIKELYIKISDQNFRRKRVIANTAAPGAVIEQTKNILYNNVDAIEEALKFAAEAEQKIAVLETELNDAERELKEQDERIKELTATKTTSKKKPAGARNE